MNNREEEVRALIASQAADWFLTQRDGILGARERKAFDEWLLASPVHVEEYLGVAVIALALPTAADDPASPLDAILERARTADEADVRPLRAIHTRPPALSDRPPLWARWQFAAAALLSVVIVGLLWWHADRIAPQRYATGHGEQRTWPLSDGSVLHLNTDSAVTIHYGSAERLVDIDRGQALFEVAHEPARRFRVVAGGTNIVAVGTQFDVFKDHAVTVVTVVAGQVIVSSNESPHRDVPVGAGEQVRVIRGMLPDHATPVDIQRSIAWLRREIVFDQEPLGVVVAEFNRYGTVPIEIESPSLQGVAISGVFAIGDTETFVAFLRTLDDATVETTATRIRVFSRPMTPRKRSETR
jgi:transmembrane sensor